MSIPEVWLSFGTFLHQDFLLMYPDFYSGITDFVSTLSEHEKVQFKSFISLLADSSLSESELQNIWKKSQSQLRVSDVSELVDEIDKFLEKGT